MKMQTTNENKQRTKLRSLLKNPIQVKRSWTLKNIIYCTIAFVYLLYFDAKERVTKTLRKTVVKNAIRIRIKIITITTIISNTKTSIKVTSRTRDCATHILAIRKIQI